MAIKTNYLVEKRNILNELRSNSMTLQELRFFSIYLAKINPRDINTRLVRFSLEDFQKIMELGRINKSAIRNAIDDLLCKVVHIPKENGGFSAFQLFKECSFDKNEFDEWYIEIDAHDKALPLLFEFKNKYFSYQLWNALRLKSSNQLRMYEVLKQYEKSGERILSITELKVLLGISNDDYSRWDNFKKDVLEVCKKSLEENTDIKFTYEPHGKRGKGNKILFLKFTISKNEKYYDPLTLDEFIGKQNFSDDITEQKNKIIENPYQNKFDFLKEACENEFSDQEFQLIYNLVIKILPCESKSSQYGLDIDQYNYLTQKYAELNLQASRRTIKSRFGYLKKLIEIDLE